MINRLTRFLRRRLRALRRGGAFPVRLPHCRGGEDGGDAPGPAARPADPARQEALRLCDGTRTLRAVAREAQVSLGRLLAAHEEGQLIVWPRPAPREAPGEPDAPDDVILSPHPDDAALSLGGRLIDGPRAGRGVLVVNVFSRTAWWRFPLTDADLPRVQAARDAEEAMVSRLTGAAVRSLALPEALLRGHTIDQVFIAAPGPADVAAGADVERAVRDLARVKPGVSRWFLPLGVGGHLDHRLVRDAARRGLEAAGVDQGRLIYYAELPYAADVPGRPDFSKALVGGPDLSPQVLPLRAGVLRDKLELLRVYQSQLTASQIASVGRYSRSQPGGPAEVVWRVGSCPTSDR